MLFTGCILLPLFLILLPLAGIYAIFRLFGWLRPTEAPIANPHELRLNPKSTMADTGERRATVSTPRNTPKEDNRAPAVDWHPLLDWFGRKHILVQTGMIILFLGIGFLFKYSIDQGWLPLEIRLILAAWLGIALTGIGWSLRKKRRDYGLVLLGGGLGILYLTTYGALTLAGLPPLLAFVILAGLSLLYALLATLSGAQLLAFMAIVGAFLAPLLTTTGVENPLWLFGYCALINVGILAIAWFKAWRSLNLTGFIFTAAIGAQWGSQFYLPHFFTVTELFLTLFFLFYVAIPVLFSSTRAAANGQPTVHPMVDVTLIYGNALVALWFQAYLLGSGSQALGWSAIVGGLLYGLLALLFITILPRYRRVTGAYLALSNILLALGIFLLFDPQVTSALWAMLGATLVWTGTRYASRWQCWLGGFIQLGAGLIFFFSGGIVGAMATMIPLLNLHWAEIYTESRTLPFLNADYAGMITISMAALWSGYWRYRAGQPQAHSPLLSHTLIGWWGMGWWYAGGVLQTVRIVADHDLLALALIVFFTLSVLVSKVIYEQLHWPLLRLPMASFLPILSLLAIAQLQENLHHFVHGGWLIWPIALAAHFWLLYTHPNSSDISFSKAKMAENSSAELDQPKQDEQRSGLLNHVGGIWLIAALLATSGLRQAQQWQMAEGWLDIATMGGPLLIVWCILELGPWFARPLAAQHRFDRSPENLDPSGPAGDVIQTFSGKLYVQWGAGPVLWCLLYFGLSISFNHTGNLAPLPYLPLLNLVDLLLLTLLLALMRWLQIAEIAVANRVGLKWVLGSYIFLLFNGALIRSVHHLAGVPFEWEALFQSALLQIAFVLTWGIVALGLMVIGHRQQHVTIWYTGGVILGVTVLKLFFVDLANTEPLVRIVSFIGVGLLMIVIAYFAPSPPVTSPPLTSPPVTIGNEQKVLLD